MHTPEDVTLAALNFVQEKRADCFVAVGGGSTTGLSKALALRTDLPQIVIPTTYAGSEATPILGQTKDGVKTTLKDAKVLPEVIVYDVDLTFSLPKRVTVT
jgi:maleylacetate reductase